MPGETVETVEAQIRSILDSIKASDPDFRASVRTTLVRDAFEVSEDEPIVKVVRQQAARLLGHEPTIVGSTPWMDLAILSTAGIPTVNFGPGGEDAHAVVEWAFESLGVRKGASTGGEVEGDEGFAEVGIAVEEGEFATEVAFVPEPVKLAFLDVGEGGTGFGL